MDLEAALASGRGDADQIEHEVAHDGFAAAADRIIVQQRLPVQGSRQRHQQGLIDLAGILPDARACPSGRTTILLAPRFLIFSGAKVGRFTCMPTRRSQAITPPWSSAGAFPA